MRGNLSCGTTFDLPVLYGGRRDAGPLQVDACSQLTKAYEGGSVIDLNRRMVLATGGDGEPTLFSIGTSGQLYATRRDGNARHGWQRREIVPGPPRAADEEPLVIDSFAVGWHAEGLATAVAVRPASQQEGPSIVYWTPHLADDGTSEQWLVADVTLKGPVHFMEIGRGHEEGPDLFVAGAAGGSFGEMQRLLLGTDKGPLPFRLPHDWTRVLDLKIGSSDIGYGAYVLYEVGGGRGISFVTFINKESGTPRTRIIATGSNPYSLAVADDEQGLSRLFVGSEYGVHLLTAHEQGKSVTEGLPPAGEEGPRGTQVLPAGAPIRNLVVTQDEEGNDALYALTDTKELWHTAHDGTAWNKLTVIRSGVEAVAAARERGQLVHHFFAASEDPSEHAYFWQSESTIWQHDTITLPDDGSCRETHRYLTRVALRKADGSPAASLDLRVSAEDGAQLEVNGHTRFVRPGESLAAETDPQGVINIGVRAKGISTPRVSLSIAGVAQTLTIDPAAHVTQRLAKTDAATLKQLKDRDGKPLLKGRFATDEGAGHAAAVLRQLSGMTDEMAQRLLTGEEGAHASLARHGVYLSIPGRRASGQAIRLRPPEAASPQAFALDLTGDTVRLIEGDAALAETRLRVSAGGPITFLSDWFGNLVQTIKESFAGKIAWVLVEPLVNGARVVLQTIEGAVEFVVKTAKQALHALDAIMKSVLGFNVEDLIHWLGVVFDPVAIRQVHDVLEGQARGMFRFMRENLGEARKQADQWLDGLRDQWREIEKASDEYRDIKIGSVSEEARQQEKEHAGSPTAALTRNPVMSWGGSQLLPGGSSGAAAIFQPVLDVFEELFKTLQRVSDESLMPLGKSWADAFDHAGKRLSAAAESQTLTFGHLIEILGEGLVEMALASGKAIIDALFIVLEEFLITMEKVLFNTRIPIPLICPLFEKILLPGKNFTIANAFLFAPAVAISAIGRALTGKTPLVSDPAKGALAGEADENFRLHWGFWGAGVAGLVLTMLTDLSSLIRSHVSVGADAAQLPAIFDAGMQLFEVFGRLTTLLLACPGLSYFAPSPTPIPAEWIGNWALWGCAIAFLLFDTAVMGVKALTGRKELSVWVAVVKCTAQGAVNFLGPLALLGYRITAHGVNYVLGSLAAEGWASMIGEILVDYGTELSVTPGTPEQMAAQIEGKKDLIKLGGVVLGVSRALTGIRLIVAGKNYLLNREEYRKTYYWTYW